MIIEIPISKNGFTGFVKLDVPSYVERLQILKESQANQGEEKKDNAFDQLMKGFEMLKARVSEVKLVHEQTKTEINDLDALGFFKGGSDIISQDLLGALYNGVQLGND